MNFYSPAISFKKDNEDYNILDCSSQYEIDQEEITDTSSPECSGKKCPISAFGCSSPKKRKFSVKRKLLLQKPILDIHPTKNNSWMKSEGPFQKIKRKKLTTYESNVSNKNHVHDSALNLGNTSNESSVRYGVSIGPELQECNYNPTHAALTAGLIKSPRPELISGEDSKVQLEIHSLKDEIICSQDSSSKISSEGEEQLSIKEFCRTSDLTDIIGHEDNLNDSDIKEEIICSQNSLLDIPIQKEICITESTKLNGLSDPIKLLQEKGEGNEGNLNDSDIKEEIICSQDSLMNISIQNDKCFTESAKLNGLSNPVKVFQKEGHKGNLSDSDIKEEIICSQDSLLDNTIQNGKYITEPIRLSEPTTVLQEEDEEGTMSNSDTHKEVIICSQDSLNNSFLHFKENHVFNESSSPKRLLSNEDNKDQSDFEISQEDIIYSQDSAANISGIERNIFFNSCDKANNISLSPSKFFIEQGKQEENIDCDCSEIDDSSEREPRMTKTLVGKMDTTTYLKENKQCDDPLCTPIGNNHVFGKTGIHEPNSEFFVKAPKKGRLLQRAYHIISDLKKEANLLSYEIQVGLRVSKGAFVSEPLIIHNIYFEEKNYIISCKPQNIEEFNSQCHDKENIYLFISNLPMDMRINSVIVIHYPLVALVALPVMRIILFAESRVQVISSNRVTGSIDISLPDSIIGPFDQKHMYVIKKKNSKTIIGALVDQLFGKLSLIELKLLHIFKQRTVNHTAVELLTVDSENQFCLVKDSKYILLNDLNLEVDNSYSFFGFQLMCSRVKNKIRSAAEYYSSLKFKNDFIYILEPSISSWKINHLSRTEKNKKNYSCLNSIVRYSTNHERFEFLLKEFKFFDDRIFIRDESFSEMVELQFEQQCCEHKMELISHSMPLVLCGIYFLNGCLYYDKYSQLMVL